MEPELLPKTGRESSTYGLAIWAVRSTWNITSGEPAYSLETVNAGSSERRVGLERVDDEPDLQIGRRRSGQLHGDLHPGAAGPLEAALSRS